MKRVNPWIKVVMTVIIALMLVIFAYTLYCIVYRAASESDFAYFLGYTTFVNKEDNMGPDYKTNDLVILQKDDFYYSTNEVVLYNFNSSYRLGRINKATSSKYYIGDNTSEDEVIIEGDKIIGRATKSLGGMGGLFGILTSIPAMIVIVLTTLIYFALNREA